MALFEKMGDTILSVGKDVSQKARDMSGITRLKFNIRSKEDFVREQYTEIGKIYYERHKGEDVPEQEIFVRIDEALEEIAQMEQQIMELKGSRKCPDCGAEASETAAYCSVCGAKLSVVVEDAPVEEKTADIEIEIVEEKTEETAETEE